MLAPIFTEIKSETEEPKNEQKSPSVNRPEPAKSSQPKRIAKRSAKDLGTPSIKDALKGKFNDDNLSAKEQHEIYSKQDEKEDFTAEQFKEKWDEFVARLDDRPNLKSTLLTVPEFNTDYKFTVEIQNNVQENAINSIKPELVSWLRKELKNSNIQLNTKITAKTNGRIIYSDNEKFEEMLKKNPFLAELKKKFNLDFGQ